MGMGGWGLVLPQFGMPDLVDSPRKALPALRNGWEMGKEEVRGGGERGGRKGRGGNWGWYVK